MVKSGQGNEHLKRFVSEFFGTFFLVLFGVGSVNEAVLTGELYGAGQVLLVWGIGCTLAVYASAHVSGGHINPAISTALAIVRPKSFSPSFLPTYLSAQFLGGFIGGMTNYALWQVYMKEYESDNSIVRGDDDSKLSEMVFGGVYPNPQLGLEPEDMPWYYAFAVEAWMAAILAFMVFMLTDKNNKAVPPHAVPMLVGFTIGMLVCLYEALTVAAFNPARDFGPRFAAYLLGWGSQAIPGSRNGFWVYLVAPLVGGPIGGAVYEYTLGYAMADDGADQGALDEPLLDT